MRWSIGALTDSTQEMETCGTFGDFGGLQREGGREGGREEGA